MDSGKATTTISPGHHVKKVTFLLIVAWTCAQSYAQDSNAPSGFIRLYEDNDGINAFFKGQDWGYTNGTRIDFFWQQKRKSGGLLRKLSPSAGAESITTKGWGLMQTMFTPQKTRLVVPDKNDYPYAGGLFAIHSIHSANSKKKLIFQTEWIAGILGPGSMAQQTQVFLHSLIGDPKPMGWDYQLPTDFLFNYNLTVEKRIAAFHAFEIATGGQGSIGTMHNGLSAFGLLRIRHQLSNYTGLRNQYFSNNKNRVAFSVAIKPSIDVTFYNAFLDGGLFNSHSPVNDTDSKSGTVLHKNIITAQIDGSILVSWRHVSLSFSQKTISSVFRNHYSHNVGNISLYFGW